MSEKVYLLLLHLYPRQFRQTYGEEAMQLFRDRLQDETGVFRRIRLWLDLLLDLGALHVRGYHEATLVGAAAEGGSGKIPSFASLEGRALEARFLLWGGVLSLILCSSALFTLQQGGRLHFAQEGPGPNAVFSPPKMNPKIVFSYEPRRTSKGSLVRLHAVVSADGDGPKPTGKVNFLHGWDIFVAGTLVNGSVTVEAKVPRGKTLPLNALYVGDSNYHSASSVEKAQ